MNPKLTHCFKQNKNKEVDIVLDLIFKSQVKTVKMGDFDGLIPILKVMNFFVKIQLLSHMVVTLHPLLNPTPRSRNASHPLPSL